MQASGLIEFIPFIHTSAIWGQSCCHVHLASCIAPAPQQFIGGGSICWITVLGASFPFGDQKSPMTVTFLFINMAGDIFISHQFP